MPWVKLDDMFSDHPKVIGVGPVAECLFVRGLTYAARYLTDGFVPAQHLRRMADMDAIAEADKLAAAGLWETEGDGYRIHDYLDYQPSAEKVKAEREAARERMQRHRSPELRPNFGNVRPKFANPVPVPGVKAEESVNPPVGPPIDEAGADAPDAQPDDASENRTKERPVRAVPKPTKRTMPADFAVTVEMREQAHGFGLSSEDIDFETEKFIDNFRGNGEKRVDWTATWRNWMRRVDEFKPRRPPARASPNGLTRTEEARAKVAAFQAIGRGERRIER